MSQKVLRNIQVSIEQGGRILELFYKSGGRGLYFFGDMLSPEAIEDRKAKWGVRDGSSITRGEYRGFSKCLSMLLWASASVMSFTFAVWSVLSVTNWLSITNWKLLSDLSGLISLGCLSVAVIVIVLLQHLDSIWEPKANEIALAKSIYAKWLVNDLQGALAEANAALNNRQ